MIDEKYEEINFPVFGQYIVRESGHVTKVGDMLTLKSIAARFNGLVYSGGCLTLQVSREHTKPFDVWINFKTATARIALGHYVGLPGVPVGRFTHTAGNADHARLFVGGTKTLLEGANLFNLICGLDGKTVRIKSAFKGSIPEICKAFPNTSLYENEDLING